MNHRELSLALAAGIVAAGTWASPAAADAVSDFYKGKTVTVMVPSGLGASLGLYGRLLTNHIKNHIPGKPNVIVSSRPGGGGTKGASFAYNAAPKDGTFIAEVLAPSVLAPALRNMKFDATKFQWLGSITPRPATVTVWHTAPATTLAQAKKVVVKMGSTGLSSETYMIPTLMNHFLGTKFKVIKGYKGGGSINKAMEQGEVQGRMNYYSGWTSVKSHWIKNKKIIHLVQYGPAISDIPNIPQLMSLMPTKEAKVMLRFIEVSENLGMGFWVAPEVPKARFLALRKAFAATMRDPAFLADAKKRRAPVNPVAGAKLTKIVAAGLNIPGPVVKKLRKILGFKKK